MATLLVLLGTAVLSGFPWENPRVGLGELQTLTAAVLLAVQILTLENSVYRFDRSGRVTGVM